MVEDCVSDTAGEFVWEELIRGEGLREADTDTDREMAGDFEEERERGLVLDAGTLNVGKSIVMEGELEGEYVGERVTVREGEGEEDIDFPLVPVTV